MDNLVFVGPGAFHLSFDDDLLMKVSLLMILCLISLDIYQDLSRCLASTKDSKLSFEANTC